MKVPTELTLPQVRRAVLDIHERLARIGTSEAQNQDLRGTRMTNAGKAVELQDYVTLEQALDLVRSAVQEEVPALIAHDRATFVERLTAAIRASTAPAAVADVPTWLADILDGLR